MTRRRATGRSQRHAVPPQFGDPAPLTPAGQLRQEQRMIAALGTARGRRVATRFLLPIVAALLVLFLAIFLSS
jgi:hypothetical protein